MPRAATAYRPVAADPASRLEPTSPHPRPLLRYPLYTACITKQIQAYKYEVCPFKSAKQDFTKLGDWKGWADVAEGAPKRMRFTGGQYCAGAGAREIEIDVSCGVEDALLELDEPETCKYHATMTSPAAC